MTFQSALTVPVKQVYLSENQSFIPTLLKVPAVYQMLALFRFLWSVTSTFCRQACEWFLIFTSTTADSAFSSEKRLQVSSVKLIAYFKSGLTIRLSNRRIALPVSTNIFKLTYLSLKNVFANWILRSCLWLEAELVSKTARCSKYWWLQLNYVQTNVHLMVLLHLLPG